MSVKGIMPVQTLNGGGSPFERLIRLVSSNSEAYCGIDAPFSVPMQVHAGRAERAWRIVADLPRGNRPFPAGCDLVNAFAPGLPRYGVKILRETERAWKAQKVNVRSTMWDGPRGGAPFTSACMTLLARCDGPVWPIRLGGAGATICEAFPAAQLRHWSLPYTGYSGTGSEARSRREHILATLVDEHGLAIGNNESRKCIDCADALDSVLCCYSAAAVAFDRLAIPPGPQSQTEGHIAVFG